MKIIDKALLKSFGGPGRCELCGRPCRERHAHHLFSRGAGRLDVRINLISLCGPWTSNCHGKVHDGATHRSVLIAIVAKREKTTPKKLVAEIYRLRRLPKDADPKASSRGSEAIPDRDGDERQGEGRDDTVQPPLPAAQPEGRGPDLETEDFGRF